MMFRKKKSNEFRGKKMFYDNCGRPWSTAVTVNTIKRVRDELGVDLADGVTVIEDVSSDIVKLIDVLFVICQPQAEKAGVSDEQFGEALVGDVLGDAVDAFIEGIVDFFPKAKRRVLRQILGKSRETEAMILDTLGQNLISPELSKRIAEQLNLSTTTLGN